MSNETIEATVHSIVARYLISGRSGRGTKNELRRFVLSGSLGLLRVAGSFAATG